MTRLAWAFGVGLGLGVSGACGGGGGDGFDCLVGSHGCPCTSGGACDAGLACVDDVCLDVGGESGTDASVSTTAGTSAGTSASTTASTTDPTATSGVDDTTGGADGPKLDVRSDESGGPTMGCSAIDMLFVLDSSASMQPERTALAATNAFTQIVTILEGLNGGGIDYRIGVTDDNDSGYFVPPGWGEPDPWFDSAALGQDGVVTAFNAAVAQIGGAEPPLGCEHVLTSATDLLDGDPSGFVRADALLVLVLLTDVDDYGAYDQLGGNTCGLGCQTAPDPVADLTARLVDVVKGGQMDGLAAIVIAGDPGINGGLNFCNQPGSCCGGIDCQVFHADRLWQFAGMLGQNGYTANLCNTSAPDAVETALGDSINLACMEFEPEG